jgi:hypothetical protein
MENTKYNRAIAEHYKRINNAYIHNCDMCGAGMSGGGMSGGILGQLANAMIPTLIKKLGDSDNMYDKKEDNEDFEGEGRSGGGSSGGGRSGGGSSGGGRSGGAKHTGRPKGSKKQIIKDVSDMLNIESGSGYTGGAQLGSEMEGGGFFDSFMSVLKPLASVAKVGLSLVPLPQAQMASSLLGAVGASKPKRGRKAKSALIPHSELPGSSMAGGGSSDGRKRRAEIVKKIMKERGVKMIEASKIVKAEGLYKK